MNNFTLVYPMFAMVVLTFAVLVKLFRTRAGFVKEGTVSVNYFNVYQGGDEPETSAKLARHFTNLFEAPVLFYAGCITAMVTSQVSFLVTCLAWLYVILRCAHAFIHTGSNELKYRIPVYFTSWAVLLTLWGSVVVGLGMSS